MSTSFISKATAGAFNVMVGFVFSLVDVGWGFTIHIKTQECAKILVSTINEYLRIVNKHYRMNNCGEPWDPDDNSNASRYLVA